MLAYMLSTLIAIAIATTVVGAIGARTGQPRRNAWFGFRTATTQRSEAAWIRAQHAGWRRRIVILPVYVVALAAVIVTGSTGALDAWAIPIVSFCGLAGIATAVWSTWGAQRAARTA